MRAIETHWKGYRFRSRLEARWAVFFDKTGVRWEYEPEGFELTDGGRYLPDFFLPDIGLWVEIKPGLLTVQEAYKATQLVAGTKQPLFISAGMPDEYGRLVWHTTGENYEADVDDVPQVTAIWRPQRAAFHATDHTFGREIFMDHRLPTETVRVVLGYSCRKLRPLGELNFSALEAARGARFEFGEAP